MWQAYRRSQPQYPFQTGACWGWTQCSVIAGHNAVADMSKFSYVHIRTHTHTHHHHHHHQQQQPQQQHASLHYTCKLAWTHSHHHHTSPHHTYTNAFTHPCTPPTPTPPTQQSPPRSLATSYRTHTCVHAPTPTPTHTHTDTVFDLILLFLKPRRNVQQMLWQSYLSVQQPRYFIVSHQNSMCAILLCYLCI